MQLFAALLVFFKLVLALSAIALIVGQFCGIFAAQFNYFGFHLLTNSLLASVIFLHCVSKKCTNFETL